MILKRLEIYGFKSFGTKTVINFDNDITAIVGPNGSGKSNIVDAVKWVIGEQRARILRGSKMEDVIFTGSDEKRSMGYAQVTLTLDNTSGIFGLDYTEITVTRRLYRSGESEYYINKAQCRLRDVQELFMDTGLGREGYSIIGQGQIESIVNNSSVDRKLMLEEAVGIVKYKTKKEAAERNLLRATDNLSRVNDIILEIEKRLPVLKRQSDKAKKFVELKNELKDIELSLFVEKMKDYNETIEKLESESKDFAGQLELLDIEGNKLDVKYHEAEDIVNEYDDLINDINGKIHDLVTNYENSKTQIAVSNRNVETNEAEMLEKGKLVEELEKSIDEQKDAIVNFKNQINQMETALSELKDLVEAASSSEDPNFGLEYFLNKAILTDEELELKNRYTDDKIELGELTRKKEDIQVESSNKYTNLKIKQGRLEMLTGFEESIEGYHFAIKKLLGAKDRFEELQDGMYGTVADLIEVDYKYSDAITKALGSSMENIVVKNESVASFAIGLLKKYSWGRVTFLPRNIVKPSVRNDKITEAKNLNGFVSYADDLVKCEERFSDIVSNLLGRVIIADTLDNANAMAKKLDHRFRIVTLNGEILFPGGAITGGQGKDDSVSQIRRNAEIKKLKEEIEKANDEYNETLKEISNIDEKIKAVSLKLEADTSDILASQNDVILSASEKRSDLEKQFIEKQGEIRLANQQYSNDYDKIEADKNTLESARKRIQELDDSNTLERQNIEYYTAIDRNYNDVRKELEDKFATYSEKKKSATEEYKTISDQILNLTNEKNSLIKTSSGVEVRLEKARFEAERLMEDIQSDYNLSYFEAVDLEVAEVEGTMEEKSEKVAELKREIKALGSINTEALEEFNEENDRYTELTKQRDDLLQSKDDLSKIIMDMSKAMVEQFKANFELIQIQFNEIFSQLFENGQARLVLTNPDDLFTTGVEIEAKPNSNKLKNISALSGGEKSMTAIALVFAILKVKPTPFLILDEIDAALDEINVDKLGKYLLKMGETNQLIVVTHKKQTMEIAQSLYGATMGADGVTQVLNVNLKQLVREDFYE